MLSLKYLITITKREFSEQYLEFFRERNVITVLSTLCNGTATEKTLDFLGLEKTDKVLFKAMVPEAAVGKIMKDMLTEMNLGASGNGIAITVPVDGIGGRSGVNYFVGDQEVEKKEDSDMSETKFSLIITIVDKGNTDTVMDAARSVGARGGTVIRAKGTGAEIAKFFGMSITEEKEMIYIVSGRGERDAIMRAIMEQAGSKTPAHGVVFALPVDSVAGLQSLTAGLEK